MAEEPRYRFGPLEQHGFLLGLRAGQVAALGAGLLLVLAIVILSQQALPGIVVGVLVAAAVFVPIGGRTLEQWAPVVLGYAVRRALGRQRWTSQAPARGHRLTGRRGQRVIVAPPVALPPSLRGLSIVTATDSLLLPAGLPAGIGMISDRAAGTYTAVLRGHGRTFALCDEAEQAALVEGWAEVLASMADSGSPIRRLQVIERTLPDTGEDAARYLREEMRRPASDDLVRSYLELLDEAAPESREHETLVAVQVDARKLGASTRQFKDRDLAAYVALVQELGSLSDRLLAAGISVEGALPPRLLAEAVRVAFEPWARLDLAQRAMVEPDAAGTDPSSAWPVAAEDAWSRYRTDGAWHAVYWVREWPRIAVRPDFLEPLILRTRALRTLSLVMEPISPQRAQREVERQRTHALSDQATRERHGFMTSRRREHEIEQVLTREDELASGHEELRFTGYVAVSAPDVYELELACKEVQRQ
ncbi:MAG TPA: SCO6880 family protein, partial [Candidatus Dormibacteraeota bacterium]|nr:SCO6880 family protein [Candidatus Dormibacteraeota bacterium]